MRRRSLKVVAAVVGLAVVSALVPASAAAPPDGGTISIEPKIADADAATTTPVFVNAAGEALAAKGFTILEGSGHAAYVAELILSRVDVGTGSARASAGGAAIQPGGGAGVGAGVTIPLPTGKSRLVPLQRIRLEMRISKRGEEAAVWHGAAVTVRGSGTREGANGVVAAALTEALLRSYPAESQDDVGVP